MIDEIIRTPIDVKNNRRKLFVESGTSRKRYWATADTIVKTKAPMTKKDDERSNRAEASDAGSPGFHNENKTAPIFRKIPRIKKTIIHTRISSRSDSPPRKKDEIISIR